MAALDAGADDYVDQDRSRSRSSGRRVGVGLRVATLQRRLADRVTELERALAHVTRLQGLLPICMYCKKIRNDQNYWTQVETYVSDHSDARFSHGICPECRTKHIEPELERMRQARGRAGGGPGEPARCAGCTRTGLPTEPRWRAGPLPSLVSRVPLRRGPALELATTVWGRRLPPRPPGSSVRLARATHAAGRGLSMWRASDSPAKTRLAPLERLAENEGDLHDLATVAVLVGLFLLIAAAAASVALAQPTPPLVFGVLNQQSPALTAERWNPILALRHSKSGVPCASAWAPR